MTSLSSIFLILPTLVVVGSDQISNPKFSRDDFPSNFVFGAGTSSYQVEGAAAEDGRSPCLWDTFTHQGNAQNKSTGDIAADQYHKYKEDVKIMSDIGLEAYRFSISWSRLLPYGRGVINQKGLEYYNNLINELVSQGIEPHVTIFHNDLPQILEDEYEGWLSPRIIEDFRAYADVCFREFGDRVTHWTTINEPNVIASVAYGVGAIPPQRCSPGDQFNCTKGNSSVEPYIVMHHLLLAHVSVVATYREKYQAKQKGLIGLNLSAFWFKPLRNSTIDAEATQRSLAFFIGWVVDPLVFGDYPERMKKNLGSRIPSFTKRESRLIKGSFDFIGMNHYSTYYIYDYPPGTTGLGRDAHIGVIPADYNSSSIQNLLEYFRDHYGNPPVYIHETGYSAPYNETLSDTSRIDFISGFIGSTLEAIRNGTNTKGFFVWSFLDVFEGAHGYQARYGIVHVDFEDKNRKRQPKLSAKWYSNLLKNIETSTKKTNTDEVLSIAS